MAGARAPANPNVRRKGGTNGNNPDDENKAGWAVCVEVIAHQPSFVRRRNRIEHRVEQIESGGQGTRWCCREGAPCPPGRVMLVLRHPSRVSQGNCHVPRSGTPGAREPYSVWEPRLVQLSKPDMDLLMFGVDPCRIRHGWRDLL